MDDLIEQLRHLGDATESSVPPVTAAQARSRRDDSQVTDIGLSPALATVSAVCGVSGESGDEGAPIGGARRATKGRPSGGKVLAAAAAVLLVLVGSVVLIRSDDADRQIELAGAMQAEARFAAPDDNGWSELRSCESSADYTTDTGNTLYGAYQLTRPAWRDAALALGLADYLSTSPADAPPYVQDAVANRLYLDQGVEPWPFCDRYIEGPMITPVVPQWLGQQRTDDQLTIVFNSPDVGNDQLAEIRQAVETIVGTDDTTAVSMAFIDKEAAFAEFQAQFWQNERVRESVQVDAMPTSFRITAALSAAQLDDLRDVDGVFEVWQGAELGDTVTSAPMRLSIPAIGLEAPIYPSPSTDNLGRGPAVIVNDPTVLVVGGHGSVDGSVFDRLDELRAGDVIAITSLVVDHSTTVEVSRTFTVAGGDDAPATREIGDALRLWRGNHTQRLTLVADVHDGTTLRLLVRAELVDPDLTLYPSDAE